MYSSDPWHTPSALRLGRIVDLSRMLLSINSRISAVARLIVDDLGSQEENDFSSNLVLVRLAEQSADDRKVAEDRHLRFGDDILIVDQAANRDRVAIMHRDRALRRAQAGLRKLSAAWNVG